MLKKTLTLYRLQEVKIEINGVENRSRLNKNKTNGKKLLLGVIVLLLSYLKYKHTEKQLDNESFHQSSSLNLCLTIIILTINIILILYLIENTNSY